MLMSYDPQLEPMLRLALLLTLCVGCNTLRPSDIVPNLPEGPVIVVKEVRLPSSEPWYTRFAVHSWIDYRDEGQWWRIGVPNSWSEVRQHQLELEEAAENRRWDMPVRVIDVVTGERAARAIPTVHSSADLWVETSYAAFPGPNSNTFIESILRETGDLNTQLSPNAPGADYAWFRAGRPGSGTGFEIETPFIGIELGLREGIQLHLLQLTAGLRFWRPAILLPFLPAIGP